MHGKQSICTIKEAVPLFEGLYHEDEEGRNKLKVARYHSLAAKAETLPDTLEVIATSDDDQEVMAVKHKDYDVYGLQFHPESILTPEGMNIIKNYLNI